MPDPAPRSRRDLDLIPLRHQEKPYVLVNDDLRLVGEGTLLPWALYELMALLDGKNSLRDIQFMMMRQRGGVLVGTDELERLIAELDRSYLLETDHYQEARARLVADFSAKASRPCSHCGRAYPSDPDELRRFLDNILASPSPSPGPVSVLRSKASSPVMGLVAPHIDLNAGARVYGSAYRRLQGGRPKRIIILGVGHKMPQGLFCLTDKDFETPFGLAKTDQLLVRELRRAGKDCLSEDDFAHRSEHSLEFQVVFLQHVLGCDDFSIVPILCGSLVSGLPAYSRKAYLEKTGAFLDALSGAMKSSERETILVAGVDLSHIGPKFGHEVPASHLQGRTKVHDETLIKALAARDAEAYWEESARERDQYNVCGFSALACLMEVLPPAEGEILDYQMWHEEATRSAVSFAAVAFIGRKNTGQRIKEKG